MAERIQRRWITRFDMLVDGDSSVTAPSDGAAHALDLATSRPLDEVTGQPRYTLCGMPLPHGQRSWYYATAAQLALRDLCGLCSYLAGRPTVADIREAG
jgi:hypothetical protein